jgi:hypothetical protein
VGGKMLRLDVIDCEDPEVDELIETTVQLSQKHQEYLT